MVQIENGDCLELLKTIPDNSIDLVLTDPPYGTTANKWDSVIPFDLMWKELKRVVKKNRAIILFGSEPFSSLLRVSNLKSYKYDWVWNKRSFANQVLAKHQPLKIHENVIVFSNGVGRCDYNPQGLIKCDKVTKQGIKVTDNIQEMKMGRVRSKTYFQEFTNYPRSIIEFGKDVKRLHPTQKPIALLEYLIKTHSNENDTVLDFTMGSGSTGVACVKTNRNFIGFEIDKQYFDIARERIFKR